jgi:DNA modification methylase
VTYAVARRRGVNGEINRLYPEDRSVHEWYRFVLSFPPHLVRDYLTRFGIDDRHRVLDPFCGTGTVVVECKKLGIPSVGIEANAMAQFAGGVKVDWRPEPEELIAHATAVAAAATDILEADGIEDDPLFQGLQAGHGLLRGLPPALDALLLADSISPLPLHKALILLDCIKAQPDERYRAHELLALAKVLVYSASNLHFGPEVGVGSPKADAPVIGPWLAAVRAMAEDLATLPNRANTAATVHRADARQLSRVVAPCSIDGVITSPPYPNEKDYTRTTRLESVVLGFIRNKAELRALKKTLIRSNTRGVYREDDDDRWVAAHPEIQRIAETIEQRRIELGKTSGFERLYHRVTRLYFGGMARHLAELRTVLRPGAQLAYVVGDQASYLRVMIRTGQLLADIAQALGYELVAIDLFRTRLATATREQLREEVVVLRWPGEPTRNEQALLAKVATTGSSISSRTSPATRSRTTCVRPYPAVARSRPTRCTSAWTAVALAVTFLSKPKAAQTVSASSKSNKTSPCAQRSSRGSSAGRLPPSSWAATLSPCLSSRRARAGPQLATSGMTGWCHQSR